MFESVGEDPALEAELLRMVRRSQPDLAGLEGTAPGMSPGLEAIIEKHGRPVLFVFMNQYEVPVTDEWAKRLSSNRTGVERAIKATGRVEIVGSGKTHVGTAWMLDGDIAVTNRHVAAKFARLRNGTPQLQTNQLTNQPVQVVVDFLAEFDNTDAHQVEVVEVLYMGNHFAGEPDVAFLRLADTNGLPEAVAVGDPGAMIPRDPDDGVAVIGYPAFDPRNNAQDQQRIFGGIYDVKRLAPGLLLERRPDVLAHDCTTLGGNSGSMVFSLGQGGAVGLHFWGDEGFENRAVPIGVVSALLDRVLGRSGSTSLISPVSAGGGGAEDGVEAKPDLDGREGYAEQHLETGVAVPAPQPIQDPADVLTPLGQPDTNGDPQYELTYHHYSSWMHKDRKLPVLTAVNIDGTLARGIKRERDKWYLDDRIPHEAQLGEELYAGNALDRGHLVRRLDPAWGDDQLVAEAVIDTFFFTNCAPQHESLNRREWLALEDHILENAKTHGFKACVFTGPIFSDDDPEYRGTQLPQAFWKIVVTLHAPAEGEEPALASSGYVLSQEELLTNIEFAFGEFRTFQVPLDRLRRLAKLRIDRSILEADALLDNNEEGAPYIPLWSLEDIRL